MTTTTNLGLTKPTVGGSDNTWGGTLNNNLDSVDAIFAGAGNGTSVGLNVGSGKTLTVAGTATISGTLTVPDNSIALGTKTTGNYIATIAGTSNEVEVSGSGSETAAVTIGLPAAVTVTTSVTSASFFYSSDAALKEDIQTIENPIEKVQKLRGVSYKWKDSGKKDIGLVADEVQKVLPELVVEDKHKRMDYGHMVGLLVEALKEQQKQIEDLKNANRNNN
jgi:hypothetical protein|tara:strand:- start:60 stop:722 length:663 start_codon:yes stop_codon:yes gene_type:complete